MNGRFDDILQTELSKKGHSAQQTAEILAREKIALKEKELRLMEGLPFLYGWKWYTWAHDFFESTNKINLLCAANQISKSSTQIRKAIDWATNQEKWPTLWRQRPVQFWYLYPTGKQAKIEFETKWKLFLPKGEYKDHPVYGWKEEFVNKELFAIHFNSGVHIYFKTYAQDTSALQTGTCDAIFCDEELPIEHFDELMFRLSASDGYFHMVFTATLGQDFWRQVMEPLPHEEELLPTATKKTVSLYDARFYTDGTPSHWTDEKIQMVKSRCSTHNEILKRIYGKFIKDDGGRKCEAFDMKRHMKPKHPLPPNWLIFGGVDIGSGGKTGHPSAIAFVAVSPDFRKGRVFTGWRGDGIPTTAGDVVEKFIAMKKERKIVTTGQVYDWASKDFFEIASRMGESFITADKAREKGEETLNTLFKNDMLLVYDDPELAKLAGELFSLRKDTDKKKAKDDFYDALRYCVMGIPWDWSVITGAKADNEPPPEKPMNDREREIHERRKAFTEGWDEENDRIEDEFNEWNSAYG